MDGPAFRDWLLHAGFFEGCHVLENADTDNDSGRADYLEQGISGTAIMLTFPGEPMIYYRDWADDPNCYDLKARSITGSGYGSDLAQGDFVTRNAEYQTFSHERLGYGKHLVHLFFQ